MSEKTRKHRLHRALQQARAAYDPDSPEVFASAIRAARDYLDEGELLLVALASRGEADGQLVYLGAVPAEGDALARAIEEAARRAQALGSAAALLTFFSADGGAARWEIEAVASGEN